MTLISGTPWYVDPALQPAPRWGYGLRLGTAWYDALGTGEPFVPYAPFVLTRTSATSWRATFAEPIYDDPPISLTGCYAFSPQLTVERVLPERDQAGRVIGVNVHTSEQGPYTYTLTIYGTRRVM